MQCIILAQQPSEFTTKEGTLLKGVNLTILRENLTVSNYWVSQDKIGKLGFVAKMVSNPFTDDGYVLTEIGFDEKPGFKGAPSKIVPVSFKII